MSGTPGPPTCAHPFSGAKVVRIEAGRFTGSLSPHHQVIADLSSTNTAAGFDIDIRKATFLKVGGPASIIMKFGNPPLMTISFLCRIVPRCCTMSSVALPDETMTHTPRGLGNWALKSSNDEDDVAPCPPVAVIRVVDRS